MTKDKSIFIKNIYYMLAYAFQVLWQKNYEKVAAEEFDEIQDLFAAILARGISQQIKQGLFRDYIIGRAELTAMRGKLNVQGTIRNQLQRKKILFCEYDELSVNNIFNQILKTTISVLSRDQSVKSQYRTELKKMVALLNEVDVIEPKSIPWSILRYRQNNKNYEMLMNICYFVLDGMLQTTGKGSYKVMAFSDEHMHRLYERFILAYYRKHHSWLEEIKAARVRWNLEPDTEKDMIQYLPVMQTDIFLKHENRALIIDAKYYGRILQARYDKMVLHSGNLYQIFTYVKNQDAKGTGGVSGMLLYAKTEEELTPDCSFVAGGNRISVKTLDLNKDFLAIATQLDGIVEEHFGKGHTDKKC